MDRLEDAAVAVFARHETFHPRYGWFRKGVKAASEDPDIFTKESAPVELGVGKNMVRAIRFWGRAAKVLADTANPIRPRLPHTVPSINGLTLFDDKNGLDPYLEMPGSLWLLHWWLLSPPCQVPAWWLAFNRFEPVEFTDDDLFDFVIDELDRSGSWELPVAASIKKDIDCLLRMYAPHLSDRSALDDILDCPFRELGLIQTVRSERRRYRFMLGPKLTLPPAILAHTCLGYVARTDSAARTITFSRLTHDPGSPGRAFRLTERALIDSLTAYAATNSALQITSTAGLPQLAFRGDPSALAAEAIETYYERAGQEQRNVLKLGDAAAITHVTLPGLDAPVPTRSQRSSRSVSSNT